MNMNLVAAMLDEPGRPRVHAGLDPAPDHGATSSQTPLGPGSPNVVDGRPNRLSRRRACHTDAAVAPAGVSELTPPSPERRAGDTEVTGQLHASRVAEAQQPSTSAAAGGSPSLQRARLWRPAAGPGPEWPYNRPKPECGGAAEPRQAAPHEVGRRRPLPQPACRG